MGEEDEKSSEGGEVAVQQAAVESALIALVDGDTQDERYESNGKESPRQGLMDG